MKWKYNTFDNYIVRLNEFAEGCERVTKRKINVQEITENHEKLKNIFDNDENFKEECIYKLMSKMNEKEKICIDFLGNRMDSAIEKEYWAKHVKTEEQIKNVKIKAFNDMQNSLEQTAQQINNLFIYYIQTHTQQESPTM